MPQRFNSTHLNQLLTPRITSVQLDGRKSLKRSHQVCAGGLADPRRARDEDRAGGVHTVLAWLLESAFQAAGPMNRQSCDVSATEFDIDDIPVV